MCDRIEKQDRGFLMPFLNPRLLIKSLKTLAILEMKMRFISG